MRQVGRDLDLAEEPLGPERGGEVGPENLQGHLAVMPHIFGQVDRGHPALTKLTLDGIAAGEGSVEAGDGIGHGGEDALKACGAASVSDDGPMGPQVGPQKLRLLGGNSVDGRGTRGIWTQEGDGASYKTLP